MESKLIPLWDNIVVESVTTEKQNSSGFVFLEKENSHPQKGTVIAVGPGNEKKPMQLRVGQTVIFKKYSAENFELNDKKVYVLRQEYVLAVWEWEA